MESIGLSDTSALVTLLEGREVHTSPQTTKYLDMLDLSVGEDLLRRCIGVWPHVDQIVKNRKSCILDETLRCISDGARQVAILGSGIDPLSLEIVSRTQNVMVYEFDTVNMRHKQDLLETAVPDMAGRIRCRYADLSRAGSALIGARKAGWQDDVPSVLVLEGVSYYLSKNALRALLLGLRGASDLYIILEYMVPPSLIVPERAHIPGDIFGIIQEHISEPLDVSFMDPDYVKEMVTNMNGRLVSRHTMHSIEKHRVGTNHYFPTEPSGWVEICSMLIPQRSGCLPI